jgi:hypothetical protein
VPEGSAAALRTVLRELCFIPVAPSSLAPGEACIDLRSDLARLQREQGDAWRSAFVDWLGALNRRNASALWWSYTSTAKNLLSSPLGNDCLGVLALDRYLAITSAPRVLVVGATAAQAAAMRARLEGPNWTVVGSDASIPSVGPLLRALWQFARILALWCLRTLRPAGGEPPQAVILTYADPGFRAGPDAFFGAIAQSLPVSARHVAFVHSSYRAAVPQMAAAGYHALFGELRLPDLFWGLAMTLRAWWRAGRYEAPPLCGIPAAPLLRSALRWDIGRGGYFYNVLVHPAARRLLARWRPRWLLYPYENKALEKMLLLGARDAPCKVIGYQHTSITRRHATMLFAEGEATATPLPNRIVTVGEVTRRFLETHGRYPRGIFVTGCALRQNFGPVLERRPGDGKLRLLLALSSSRRELLEAVQLCRDAVTRYESLELGIRPHPEFPASLLPSEVRDWVGRYARNLTGTALAANLEWCDAVAYVSSTVALEALGRGRPVINLALSDPLDPDPVLDPVQLHWKAGSPEALVAATREILALDAAQWERRRRQALDYIQEYLRPPTPQALEVFLPA